MTAVVAVIGAKRKIWMASDSAWTTRTSDLVIEGPAKVWRIGDYVIGVAGDASCMHVYTSVQWKSSRRWLEKQAITEILEQCRQHGTKPTDIIGLVGFRGVLYEHADQSFLPVVGGYAAIGSAQAFLLGYLRGTRNLLPPKERVKGAVMAAKEHCSGVQGRIKVVST